MWKNFKTDPPKDGQAVLLFAPAKSEVRNWWEMAVATHKKGLTTNSLRDITHWMPLPPFPNTEEDEPIENSPTYLTYKLALMTDDRDRWRKIATDMRMEARRNRRVKPPVNGVADPYGG